MLNVGVIVGERYEIAGRVAPAVWPMSIRQRIIN